ncbi:MAG TPA: aldehyde dehydrogenase family protein [Ktedonobacterales bacterium]
MAIATTHGSPQFPAAANSMPPSDRETLDAAVRDLRAHADAWVGVAVPERIALVDALMRDLWASSPRWVEACLHAKGLGAQVAGEEWAIGPYTLMKALRQTRGALADIARSGAPRVPGSVTARPNGQVVARVFPQTRYDALLFTGVTGDVWMQPGITRETLAQSQALAYRDKQHAGRVALVLGAGNVSSIGPLDILYKLFVEDQVVVFKSNPVNDYLGPIFADALRALVGPGYLRLVYGGAAEGSYLCLHPDVDEIHITGSDKTYDAIVWGPGDEGAARKKIGAPLLSKRVTGELGNVSPVIVVPGPWSAGDIAYQAAHLASSLVTNAGFNCNASRVIVTHEGWGQRPELLDALRRTLAAVPPRLAYYPGAEVREQRFREAHPEAEQLGTISADGGMRPWTLIPGVSADNPDDICFTTEAFCGLFAETPLAASNAAQFLDRAVAFCNDQLWGTLNATILVHPRSLKEPAVAAALEHAQTNLRYGTVGINYWAGTAFTMGVLPWGAYPGHTAEDIQSGNGVVHNTLMFSRPQKSLLRGPWRSTPTPPWFVTRRKAAGAVFPRLTALELAPSPAKLPGILRAAITG